MSWEEYMAARTYLAEERVGRAYRDSVRAEDAAVARSIAGLKSRGR